MQVKLIINNLIILVVSFCNSIIEPFVIFCKSLKFILNTQFGCPAAA